MKKRIHFKMKESNLSAPWKNIESWICFRLLALRVRMTITVERLGKNRLVQSARM